MSEHRSATAYTRTTRLPKARLPAARRRRCAVKRRSSRCRAQAAHLRITLAQACLLKRVLGTGEAGEPSGSAEVPGHTLGRAEERNLPHGARCTSYCLLGDLPCRHGTLSLGRATLGAVRRPRVNARPLAGLRRLTSLHSEHTLSLQSSHAARRVSRQELVVVPTQRTWCRSPS
jgi:hypothetical protein